MKRAGQVVLFRMPNADLYAGKLRPALLLARIPGRYNDWLVCMISSRIENSVEGFDEVVYTNDGDYAASGLKAASVIRIARLACAGEDILEGAIGEIGGARLRRILERLAVWLRGTEAPVS